MRLILFIALLVLLYFLLKNIFGSSTTSRNKGRHTNTDYGSRKHQGPPPPITDELVQDPVCGTYCPKREALTYRKGGTTYYFCSEECRRKFKKGKKG